MTDKRFGNRFKECRERLGLTQAELADKVKLPPNYISTVERGERFPRYDKMIQLLNALEVSADAIFCDVIDYAPKQRATELSELVKGLPAEDQRQIFDVVELLAQQAKVRNEKSSPSEKN